jgi:hypothetical protein
MKPPAVPAPSDNTGPKDSASEPEGVNDHEATGLRWLPTWRGVYLFVLGSFIVWILLLVALTGMFS